jgi:phage shock protein C
MKQAKKRLRRDEEQALVAGVLSGLARYFSQDPVLFRIAAITLLVLTGVFPGVLLYILAWVVMPKGKSQTTSSQHADYDVTE